MAQLRLVASIRNLTKTDKVDLPGGTVLDVLQTARAEFGPEFERLLFDGDRPRKNFAVLVNGRNIRFLNEFGTHVGDDDTITIIPQIAGGSR